MATSVFDFASRAESKVCNHQSPFPPSNVFTCYKYVEMRFLNCTAVWDKVFSTSKLVQFLYALFAPAGLYCCCIHYYLSGCTPIKKWCLLQRLSIYEFRYKRENRFSIFMILQYVAIFMEIGLITYIYLVTYIILISKPI